MGDEHQMTNYICINGKKAELTEEQMQKLGIKLPKANPFKRVSTNEKYYMVNPNGEVEDCFEQHLGFDNKCYEVANYCTNKAIMEQRAFRETLDRLLWRYSMEHDGNKIDWSNYNIGKHYIYYDCREKNFKVSMRKESFDINAIYFYNANIAKFAIEAIIEPFMKAHPEFKW